MTFGSFHGYFPIQAYKDDCSKTIIQKTVNDPPSGEYRFIDMFCDDPTCDCRNAIISVQRKEDEEFEEITKLRFCWENNDFYESIGLPFNHDKLPGVFPDPNGMTSQYDNYFVKFFENICYESSSNESLRQESPYAETIKQHYNLYKERLNNNTSKAKLGSAIPRNSPCQCGSGKKYKHCCFMKEVKKAPVILPMDLDKDWIKIRTAEDDIIQILKSYIEKEFGLGIHAMAKNIFALDGKISVDMKMYQVMYDL